jgi:hypothetical protein
MMMGEYQLVVIDRPGGRAQALAGGSRLGELIRMARELLNLDRCFGVVINELHDSGDSVAVYADAQIGGPTRNRLAVDAAPGGAQ